MEENKLLTFILVGGSHSLHSVKIQHTVFGFGENHVEIILVQPSVIHRAVCLVLLLVVHDNSMTCSMNPEPNPLH